MEKLASGFIDPLIGMRAEEVALRLQEIGRKMPASVAVEERESCAKTGKRHTHERSIGDDFSPGRRRLRDLFNEVRIDKKAREAGIFIESFFDFTQESAPDNAAAAPHEGN